MNIASNREIKNKAKVLFLRNVLGIFYPIIKILLPNVAQALHNIDTTLVAMLPRCRKGFLWTILTLCVKE
jgi:hypothetical protein